GQAGVSRQTRAQQLVFVNGRAVENPVLTVALREGYHTALMKGQFPVTFLFLDLDPAAVDVNVHPAKREVRFRDPNGVREAVVAAVRRTLASGREDWQEQFRAPVAAGISDPGPVTAPAPAVVSVQPESTISAATEALPLRQPLPNESLPSVSTSPRWDDQPAAAARA